MTEETQELAQVIVDDHVAETFAPLDPAIPVCSDEESAELHEAFSAFGSGEIPTPPTPDQIEAQAQVIEAARAYDTETGKAEVLELVEAATLLLKKLYTKANEHLAGEWNKAVVGDDKETQQELISHEAPYWLDKSRRTMQQAFSELDRVVNRKVLF